jgi:hypothetical protein
MTEFAQPLASASASETVTVVEQPAAGHSVSFSELVYAHFDWWTARQSGEVEGQRAARYDRLRRAFERRHGEIVAAYWCSGVESAVALTEKRRAHGLLGPTWGFHRESDWATKTSPEVAAELHRCDELAVRANSVLTGIRQRICMRLVTAAAAHLLSMVDDPVADADGTLTAAALQHERAAIDEAEKYYCGAANGQAQMVYFGGMAAVAVVISLVATVWLSITWATPVAALVAGSIGAVVSVIQRINSGRFTLEYDVGGPYAFFLGGLRPLIGGTFAMAISFAFTGGLLHLPVAAEESGDNRHLALLVLGFLAGFSERWAQDTLTSILPADSGPPVTARPPDLGPAQPVVEKEVSS